MLADPRPRPDPSRAPRFAAELYALAGQSLAAPTGAIALHCDERIATVLRERLASPDGASLDALLAHAPSLAVERHLGRLLAMCASQPLRGDVVGLRLFAIPIVLVAGMSGNAGAGATLPMVLRDVALIAGALCEHGALAGNRAFALSNALVAADAIDVGRLPALMQAAHAATTVERFTALELPPAPLEAGAGEAAHLRFLVGTAIAAAAVDLFAAHDTGRWGMALARALMSALAAPGVSLVVLPRPAAALPAAVVKGRAAQREVAAQLFASHALRQLRASVGEPSAVISAHVAADAGTGGELRLSLSSPLSPRDAYGFRCPLYRGERVEDVLAMLVDLLRDCRLADVSVLSGVHADRDPVTGGPLMFKPDTIPPLASVAVH